MIKEDFWCSIQSNYSHVALQDLKIPSVNKCTFGVKTAFQGEKGFIKISDEFQEAS